MTPSKDIMTSSKDVVLCEVYYCHFRVCGHSTGTREFVSGTVDSRFSDLAWSENGLPSRHYPHCRRPHRGRGPIDAGHEQPRRSEYKMVAGQ